MTIVEMQVHMCCAGCESKIKKALQKLKGVENVDIEMGLQKVTVTGWADEKKVLKTVRKTGRRAEIWQLPYNPELRNHNYNVQQYSSLPQHNVSGNLPPMYNTQQPSSSASSYNYYKHGYDSHNRHGYSYAQSSSIFGPQTGAAFSDENAHGCSIM